MTAKDLTVANLAMGLRIASLDTSFSVKPRSAKIGSEKEGYEQNCDDTLFG
jgi:hypothetical protein